ncbi:beta-2 adrenergic receptor-like [Oculina patagonica]
MTNLAADSVYFPVFITEFLVIFIINIITVTAFARIRHLRKRSTYLIINLTVADLLVGAVTGPLKIMVRPLYHKMEETFGFTWPGMIILTFDICFTTASQVNLCLISLERLHATHLPFRHCLIRKCIYFKIVVGSWFESLLLATLMAGLYLNEPYLTFSYVWASFNVLIILVLVVSYIIIILNVQRSPRSQIYGSIRTERKLSMTLFMVTGVSILTILPWTVYKLMPHDIMEKWDNESSVEIHEVLAVIYYANSIVNPLVYTIRMREFRKAIGNLVLRQSQDEPLLPRSMVWLKSMLPLRIGYADSPEPCWPALSLSTYLSRGGRKVGL